MRPSGPSRFFLSCLALNTPYAFDFDLTNGIQRCRLSGRVSDGELKDFFQAGAQYAIRIHPSAGVVDLSEVTSFDVSAQTIQQLARAEPVLRDPNFIRVVIAPSAETYGMMRMFEIEGGAPAP